MRLGRRLNDPIWAAGLVLIMAGIGSLIWSYTLAAGPQAADSAWWQGTLQALGVGLIVGGLVDVLAVFALNRTVAQGERINDSFSKMLESAGQYPDQTAYEAALDAFVQEHWPDVEYLDPEVRSALAATGAEARIRSGIVRRLAIPEPGAAEMEPRRQAGGEP
jgi:hypothetical protein